MKIILHPPQDDESKQAWQNKAATVHAEAVLRYINRLACPREQKIKLINALIKGAGSALCAL